MLKKILLIVAAVMSIGLLVAPVAGYAAVIDSETRSNILEGVPGDANDNAGKTINDTIKLVIDILSFVVGVVAVIAIIVAGLQFITANGDASKVSKARMSIMYAVVGLVVVAIAQVIVRFVVNRLAD